MEDSLVVIVRFLDSHVNEPNCRRCLHLLEDNRKWFLAASGSSHNHQAWPGGYLDHVLETMNAAVEIYDALSVIRPLPFELGSVLLVLFLHDLEKPWKLELVSQDKEMRRAFRDQKISEYKIRLTKVPARRSRMAARGPNTSAARGSGFTIRAATPPRRTTARGQARSVWARWVFVSW